jgi:hypothetical protein
MAMAGLPETGGVPADLVARLGAQLGLLPRGLGLYAPPDGRRLVLACTPRLPHLAGPERASLSVAERAALADTWLVAIRLRLARDWSWDGLAPRGLAVWRTAEDGVEEEVGHVPLPRAIAHGAVPQGDSPDREATELLFLDLVDPMPPGAAYPTERRLSWRVEPLARDPDRTEQPEGWEGALRLPVARAPTDRPELISAGVAATPYERDDGYTATAPRERRLWLEFARTPANPRDTLYARVLGWGPDPPLSIPEEPVRVIVPGQADDRAGLDGMEALIPTASPRHFVLPLPRGVSPGSAALHGFFRYEFCVGHAPDVWSLPRKRYGPPLRQGGVRHPPPELPCAAQRLPEEVLASSMLALAEDPDHPAPAIREGQRSAIWFLLYAQARRADGAAPRNILLSRRQAVPLDVPLGQGRARPVEARWTLAQIDHAIGQLGLSGGGGLSVVAVELLPHARTGFPDPLAGDLGEVRMLRASALVPVPARCPD